jgi:hypothetical protein
LKELYIIYSTFDIGDVFSVVYCQSLQTIYLGAQNTSIQVHFPPLAPFCIPADVSGTIYEKYPLDHGRPLRHSPIDDSINSLIRRNRILQTRAAMTTDLPKRSPYLRLSRKIKSNSLITGTFIVYVWGIFHIIRSSSCSLVFLNRGAVINK